MRRRKSMDCKIFGLRGRAHGTHKGTLSAPNGFTPPNGFTLMELLIVIAIILILMLMAIPTIGVMKKHANDTSAINSLRAITQAEIQYESSYPANGYSCTLAALGGDPGSGAPSPTAAQLLQGDLASGYKSGYTFNITNCTKVT